MRRAASTIFRIGFLLFWVIFCVVCWCEMGLDGPKKKGDRLEFLAYFGLFSWPVVVGIEEIGRRIAREPRDDNGRFRDQSISN
jgi:hypothetical protein